VPLFAAKHHLEIEMHEFFLADTKFSALLFMFFVYSYTVLLALVFSSSETTLSSLLVKFFVRAVCCVLCAGMQHHLPGILLGKKW